MIDTQYFWFNIFALAVGTFSIRSSVIYLSSRITISDRMREILSFIPAAVLPALLMPLVFFHEGNVELFSGKERFVVIIFAFLVSYKTKSMLATIGFGLVTLYALTNFLNFA